MPQSRLPTKTRTNALLMLPALIIRFAGRSYRLLLGAVALSILGVSADMGIALLIKRLTDAGLAGDGGVALAVSMMMGAAIAVGFVCKYGARYFGSKFGADTSYAMRSRLFDRLSSAKINALEKRSVGDWVSVFSNDVQAVDQFFLYQTAPLLLHPVMALGTFIFLMTLEWKLMLLCCLIVVVVYAASVLLGKPISRHSAAAQRAEGEVSGHVQDAALGHMLVKSYSLEGWIGERFRRAVDGWFERSIALERKRVMIVPWQIVLQNVPFAFCILYGGWMAVQGRIETSSLLVFIYLLGYFTQSASAIPELLGQLYAASGAARRLEEAFAVPVEAGIGQDEGAAVSAARPGGDAIDAAAGGAVPADAPALSLCGVSFSYPESERPALEDISFDVAQGEFVAIVGPSGSGKSTFVKLLGRLNEPQSGSIRLLGRPLGEMDVRDVRRLQAVVTQSPMLITGTIEHNVRFGCRQTDEAGLRQAAKAAFADSFIERLPEGYATMLGEQGSGLSGGQKQRVAIARALLRRAPILIMDEPTSALDPDSDAYIQQTIRSLRGSCTIVVVAHRLSTVVDADRIIVMNDGRIAEKGDHEQLLAQGGVYADLYTKMLQGASS